MSKLKDAIQKASLSQRRPRHDRTPGDDAEVDVLSSTGSRLAPVIYNLQAGNTHIPDGRLLERNRIIHDGYSKTALTEYKMLRTRVLQEYGAKNWTTLAITSPQDGAGKTVTAINLAMAMASQGSHQVFLVDWDLRNPSIADCLGIPDEVKPITSYLGGFAELPGLLWDVGVENLVVLANRQQLKNSSEFITSQNMLGLIKTFRSVSQNPLVIIDLPPVLAADDAVAISPLVDGVLLVVSERETQREDLADSLNLLRGGNVLGVVLNKSGDR